MKIGDFKIDWHHNTKTGVSACILEVKGESFNGFAKCSSSDNFSRVIGRKRSLARALEDAKAARPEVFTKDFKRSIWAELSKAGVKLKS